MKQSLIKIPDLRWMRENEACIVPQVIVNSPAHQAGLEPFFDYIISIDGVRLVRIVLMQQF